MIAMTCRECGWHAVGEDEAAAMVEAAGHRRETGHADFTRSQLDDAPPAPKRPGQDGRPPAG
jgi:hypothetical protein